MKIVSFSPFGYEGALVVVEVDLRRGIPSCDVVGLADCAVKESRERMRAAIRNSGLEFPMERVLINLSPADLKKEGSGFDLAIALGVLQAANQEDFQNNSQEKILIMGELELSGKIRPVRGTHAAILTASEENIKYCPFCGKKVIRYAKPRYEEQPNFDWMEKFEKILNTANKRIEYEIFCNMGDKEQKELIDKAEFGIEYFGSSLFWHDNTNICRIIKEVAYRKPHYSYIKKIKKEFSNIRETE